MVIHSPFCHLSSWNDKISDHAGCVRMRERQNMKEKERKERKREREIGKKSKQLGRKRAAISKKKVDTREKSWQKSASVRSREIQFNL